MCVFCKAHGRFDPGACALSLFGLPDNPDLNVRIVSLVQ